MHTDGAGRLGSRMLLSIACLIVVVAGLRLAHGILVPISFAVFFAIVALGAVAWLEKRGFKTWVAISLVALTVVGIFTALVVIISRSVSEITAALPVYRGKFNVWQSEFVDLLEQIGIGSSGIAGLDIASPDNVVDFVVKTLRGTVGAFSTTLLVVILVLFILAESASFKRRINLALGSRFDLSKMAGAADQISRYLLIKTFTSALTGIMVAAWVWAMRIDFPMIWGVLAFILNYIPVIGSIAASIPALMVSLVTLGTADTAVIAIGYMVINIGISNFLEPVILGRGLGLSPLIVFLSLIFWGWVWGPAGMLLSVPLTVAVKILIEHSTEFSWIARLMGDSACAQVE